MKKYLATLLSLAIACMFLVSMISAVSAVTVTTKEFTGKGAIAQ